MDKRSWLLSLLAHFVLHGWKDVDSGRCHRGQGLQLSCWGENSKNGDLFLLLNDWKRRAPAQLHRWTRPALPPALPGRRQTQLGFTVRQFRRCDSTRSQSTFAIQFYPWHSLLHSIKLLYNVGRGRSGILEGNQCVQGTAEAQRGSPGICILWWASVCDWPSSLWSHSRGNYQRRGYEICLFHWTSRDSAFRLGLSRPSCWIRDRQETWYQRQRSCTSVRHR